MRRRLQFSIRTLFILTTLAAVACAVGIPIVGRYREHYERQALIEVQVGGFFCEHGTGGISIDEFGNITRNTPDERREAYLRLQAAP